jgi:hypothetical protein
MVRAEWGSVSAVACGCHLTVGMVIGVVPFCLFSGGVLAARLWGCFTRRHYQSFAYGSCSSAGV